MRLCRCLTVLTTLVGVATATAAPRLVCAAPHFDFGVVNGVTQDLEHAFVLRNDGDAALTIRQVRASCGCTTTRLERQTLPPGEATELKAVFNVRGRRGPQRKAIHVESDDPATPVLDLSLAADVRRALETDVSGVYFGQMRPGEAVSRNVRVTAGEGRAFRLLSATYGALPLTVELPAEAAAAHDVRVQYKGGSETGMGGVFGELILRTDMPGFETLNLPVSGYLMPDVAVLPAEMAVRETERGWETLTRLLIVRARAQEAFKLESVTVRGVTLEYAIEVATGPTARIRLGQCEGPVAPDAALTVRVIRASGEALELVVPVRVRAL